MEYRQINNQIWYRKGNKWLIKETCETEEAAQSLLAELQTNE